MSWVSYRRDSESCFKLQDIVLFVAAGEGKNERQGNRQEEAGVVNKRYVQVSKNPSECVEAKV